MQAVSIKEGNSPVILAFPHVGLHVPAEIFGRLNEVGKRLADTDWHVDKLYDGLLPSATSVVANFHRYVVDANRAPDGASLYPGQNTTELCPTTDFEGAKIWRDGCEPTNVEIEERRVNFHQKYHEGVKAQIERVYNQFGCVILYDCHSIRSQIPYLFDGNLPDFNIGTNQGVTCASILEEHVVDVCGQASGFTHVVNGRFKGGWTTRHYARPEQNIHVIQMELSQATYMLEQEPWTYMEDKAKKIRPVLQTILTGLEKLAHQELIK
ncbi:N-formylglutamate deformylase [Sneathiella glossodoripedis]|uniref:N-formylglutamate deformylase n=1 Tax=Sneathiella glossodoripedis TaxID=418853 RepID=UPI0004725CCD|nr:N-formylglutamate deformylase [Sneathiella glossodoripedis]